VRLAAIGNKVDDPLDEEFLRSEIGGEIGGELAGVLDRSAHVRAGDRGAARDIHTLEAHNAASLDDLRRQVDAVPKDWARYQADAVRLHLRNARSWAGAELTEQVDPDFVPGALTGSAP
jgi:CO dehydrogenase maturation factor